MSLPPRFAGLCGEWNGTKRLYLEGESGPELSSAARLAIAGVARDCFLLLNYTWQYQTDPQEGVLLLGYDAEQNAATAAWGDSWHMSQKIMHCTGAIDAGDVFNVRGSYQAPPGPDWGWRIALTIPTAIDTADAITLVMHNIAPDGKEHLAVRATFARAG